LDQEVGAEESHKGSEDDGYLPLMMVYIPLLPVHHDAEEDVVGEVGEPVPQGRARE